MVNNWTEDNLISIRERVYLHIKDLILDGEFKAGDRLVERELAERLNISRTPIREALFRLESQGFVKTVPRKGVIVADISEKEIIEVFTILSSLEVLAAKLAVQKLDDEMKNKFTGSIKKVQEFLNNPEEDAAELHRELNHLLYSSAKNVKLYEMLSGLSDYIRAFAKIGHKNPGRAKQSMEEHLKIMEAIVNKEMEMAEYLTKIHIENSKKAYIEAVQQNEDKN
ncbi:MULTISPECIES: GntR family transcriptional regulator [Bacillaceae]|jgi:DNA-binding GntR family transcriptional regulator|uniref:GntR family transcriptional regulator n=1 Tax=Cytobacillus firmus TaxID=1399 RepID=A0AA46Q4E0_CYTFI|nr:MULTISPECIES: GntR family transcriptional regulator [Bacillaceae]MBG9443931.1 GntR family transcriptional regulator [Cytobacillus firmus]MBG9588996.1 GntR family transcriptional regulator [Cytobacillus firmus]MBY6050140.1 GntR family transcriptional regulator [Cytobacillus firmus]MCC3645936.1 GntR family transcriptional regulator [Cytobacillus oceanisediminis]MCS0652530.1 GntR family transcriptional regulator [Cytobacillus firmus]